MGGMATTYPIKGNWPGLVLAVGSFRPNGASGIVSGSLQPGGGFTVVRTSAGVYTVTLDDDQDWPAKVSCNVGVRSAGVVATMAQGGDYNRANKTLQIRVFQQAAAAAGFIPINVSELRELSGNAFQNLAAHGGAMASDSTPRLERINGATDPVHRNRWGSADDTENQFPNIPIPPDLDPGEDVYFKFIMGKSGSTNEAAVLAVEFRECPIMDVAGGMFANTNSNTSDLGGNVTIHNSLAGQDGGNAREYSLTIAAAGLGGGPGFFNIGLTPSAHNNDAFDLYAAWIEYGSSRSGAFVLADLTDDVDNEVSFAVVADNDTVET